jgi:hypothetical protein
MLRRNKDVPTGLVSESMGTIISIKWPMMHLEQLNDGQIPKFVLIKFDDPKIAEKYFDKDGENIIIRPICVNFDGKK